jgi:hypothetical protein
VIEFGTLADLAAHLAKETVGGLTHTRDIDPSVGYDLGLTE